MAPTTSQENKMIRSLGKCRNCKKGHRVDSHSWTPSVKCECGTTVKLQVVHGYHDEHVHCGALCRNATGPSCDCECGGANHGINH